MPTAKKTPTTQPTGVNTKGNKIALRVFWIVFGVIVVLAAIIWLPGNVKYWIAEAQCGHAPYAVEPVGMFGGGGWYTVPGDNYSKSVRNTYYCNLSQAEAAGRGRDPLAVPYHAQ